MFIVSIEVNKNKYIIKTTKNCCNTAVEQISINPDIRYLIALFFILLNILKLEIQNITPIVVAKIHSGNVSISENQGLMRVIRADVLTINKLEMDL